MQCPKCGSETYQSRGGKTICPKCGYGSSFEEKFAQQKAAMAAIGSDPDLIIEKDTWTLQIFYRNKGSKSEGQHGILLKGGIAVLPKEVGETISTSLGSLKYYMHPEDMEFPFNITGWNFADSSQIRSSWSKQQ